ncbi:MAG: NAD(P)H-hydrate dehydratase [Roseovarius sp.]|nr:NAD(P)H-hydrate dehydratase [Roseovarius sp.]
MTELLTAAQMRAVERAAIESGQVTGLELMERAGRGVVEAVFEEWPELAKTAHRAVVLCGPGNNGGDGFVVARLLKEWGWEVEVFLYGDPAKLPPDAKVNYDRWVQDNPVKPTLDAADAVRDTHLLIDALFGTGLTRGLGEEFESIWEAHLDCLAQNTPVVAVDIASGICADSGLELGSFAFMAHIEVSFHRQKLGHQLGERSGVPKVKDIGLESWQPTWRLRNELVRLVNIPADGDLPDLLKAIVDHKYDHGHALILSGGAGKTGAARLAARGALRIGAGVVTVGVPPSAQMEVAGQITALMLKRIEGADGLAEVLQDKRINALCLGPGMGLERARELVPAVLRQGGIKSHPTVLDADALSAYKDDPEALFDMLHEGCVLTPHGGEFARLFPDIAEKLSAVPSVGPAYSKVDATRAAAKRAGCVVLFKGPDTVIAHPDGRCSINSARYERAAPWLATAGSGDVLAGFITGLLARGFDPMQAAETAVWLHVECARSFGPGLIAEDLPEQLPQVFRDLEV